MEDWPHHPDGQKLYERHGLHRRFLRGPSYKVRAGHHLCINGKIKPWAKMFCSVCPSQVSIDVVMSQEDITDWNKEEASRKDFCNVLA